MEEVIYPPTIRAKCWESVWLEKLMSLRFTGLPQANRSTSSLSCPSIVIYVLRKPAVFASEASEAYLDPEFLDFLVVVLAVEDVPLLAAFEDRAFLAFDFLAGGLIDSCFLVQQVFED